MRYFSCPNCDSHFPTRAAECPSCGEAIDPSSWWEIDVPTPPISDYVMKVELHGDLGHPFVFRKQPNAMGVGRPTLAAVSSDAVKYCAREQFVLSWEGERCFISVPVVLPRNATYVDGNKLSGKIELQQGAVIDLRGASGRVAVSLTVLYS